MERYNRGGGAASAPSAPAAPANPYFTEGNPSLGVPATQPGPWWFHMMTEEMRQVITDAGLTPDHTDLTQLSAAIQAMITASLAPDATESVKGIMKIATAALAQALADDTVALTPKKLGDVLDVTALGRGQTFQNVKASRANNVNYVNSTSKPIMAFVSMTSSATAQAIFISIDGLEVQGSNGTAAGNSCYASFIVPPGSTYKCRMSSFSDILHWAELRD